MAITVGNTATYNVDEYTTTHTISAFDCSGPITYLIHTGHNQNPAVEVTSWTVDGGDATGDLIKEGISSNVAAVQIYGTKINNASFDIVSGTSTSKQQAMTAIKLTGVDQTTPDAGTPVESSGFSSTATAAYTGTAGNLLIVGISTNATATYTASGCTELLDFDHGADIGQVFIGHVVATGSSQTIGATLGGDDNWHLVIVEVTASGIPTFVGAGAIATDTTGAASTTPDTPTHVADDILIAQAWNSGGDVMSTATAGWAEITQVNNTDDAIWFWKRATGAGTAGPTITASGTDQFAICYAYRGCITTGTPYEDATVVDNAGNPTASTILTSEITTTGTDRLVVSLFASRDDTAFSSGLPPTNWFTDDNQATSTGTDNRMTAISLPQAAAATVSAVTYGTLAASEFYATLTMGLLPPSAAGEATLKDIIGSGIIPFARP